MAYYCKTYSGKVPPLSDWEFGEGNLDPIIAEAAQGALDFSLYDMLAIRLDGKDVLAQLIFDEGVPDHTQPTWRMPISDVADWWLDCDPDDDLGVSMETVAELRTLADKIERFLKRD